MPLTNGNWGMFDKRNKHLNSVLCMRGIKRKYIPILSSLV
jgi:hypothetical protein